MVDVLRNGVEWMAGRLKAFASRPIVYHRGALAVALDATAGRTFFRLEGEGSSRVEYSDVDFIVKASDLVLDGAPVTPLRGDQIRETVGGKDLVYDIRAPEQEAPWRWADQGRVMLRIHCKEVPP